MAKPSIPVINRKTPKFVFWVIAIPYYLLLVPFNWLMKKIGKPGALFNFIGKRGTKKKLAKVFEGYTPETGDIFVSTFSKSGTNWMMQIAHQIAWRGDGEFENIHDAVAWPDTPNKRSQKAMTPLDSDVIKKISPTGMRVIKTHLSAHYVPFNDQAKYLIVVRDPKEVFVSSYPFVGSLAGAIMPSVDDWLDMFLTKHWAMNFGNTWAEHTNSYWCLRNKPNVLLTSYTELKINPEAGIRRVAETLGVNLTEDELGKVIEKSSFPYMKRINHKFNVMGVGDLPWGSNFEMIRKGETGKSSELISKEQQIRIDKHFIQEFKDLGSDFPYEEFCQITE
ncbi:MAG: sulfotransferase domain-containing protein [Gammaproteobacteria bacterium]|nr:sulfotransferase domain-containing protein [Gammaproteobacteria bacterium]